MSECCLDPWTLTPPCRQETTATPDDPYQLAAYHGPHLQQPELMTHTAHSSTGGAYARSHHITWDEPHPHRSRKHTTPARDVTYHGPSHRRSYQRTT